MRTVFPRPESPKITMGVSRAADSAWRTIRNVGPPWSSLIVRISTCSRSTVRSLPCGAGRSPSRSRRVAAGCASACRPWTPAAICEGFGCQTVAGRRYAPESSASAAAGLGWLALSDAHRLQHSMIWVTPRRPDMEVTRAHETMVRAVAVFVGRTVRGVAPRHCRPSPSRNVALPVRCPRGTRGDPVVAVR